MFLKRKGKEKRREDGGSKLSQGVRSDAYKGIIRTDSTTDVSADSRWPKGDVNKLD